ncbi:MAG: hypothetical protein ACR2NB_13850 [Solirubrobacteraceae bacterium]
MKLLNRRRERRIATAVIADPEEHTSMDRSGAVRSIQAANVDMPEAQLDSVWTATHLERLARTYWWYLSRISLGTIRVHYSDDERAVVFLTRPFVLLRFHSPEYELDADRGVVRWRIRDGLLVARRDDGHLEIDVRRGSTEQPGYARVHVEVEIASFYPALARPFKWFYVNTQSRIHVIVTHGFLKRLARLELEESAVGRFAEDGPSEPEDVNVGSTPWAVVGALAAAFALVGLVLAWSFRRE